uniref:Pseudouridine synthase n=1 Tax=Candidatus Kentrum eta TaxID=2126337 RepID=A0A450VBE3_9GAMM|nr:MAG: ribosomal large subunit pseudouridine synthase C [Candidatus Kentron sp. H]VFJ96018.1 MAG: ribosomal large subunit pseudouridine synthase C [Candidatus Kentron sp. H]VFK02112.1 MAG: ribosomal large subunit pseudouridine synthase C [Candidatus Kentron sp. H]
MPTSPARQHAIDASFDDRRQHSDFTEKNHGRKSPAALAIDTGHAGQRIDNFLIGRLKGVPRTHIYRILRRGEVRVNKGRIRPDYRLQAGDVVRVPPLRYASPSTADDIPPEEKVLRRIQEAIIHEDAGLLVLNKPAGMAVHGGSGQRYGVIEALRALRPEAPYLELVHRLDRETSGCLMIAGKRSVLRTLHEGLRQHQVDKRYLLLVAGPWQGKGRRVEMGLRKNVLRSGERVVRQETGGKTSATHFRPLAVSPRASLLSAKTLTGRTHQIRVHATALGHPVAGDDKYGDRAFNREMHRRGLNRLFLHAASLDFRFRDTGKRLHVTSPLPEELARVLDVVGLAD